MKFKPGGGDRLKRKILHFLLTEEMRKKYGNIFALSAHF